MNKIKWIFALVFVVILCIVSGYISRKFTISQYDKQFAQTEAELNAKTEQLNTVTLKGESDKEIYDVIIADLESDLRDSNLLNLDITEKYQKQNEEILNWDEYVDFIPDTTEPEIREIIKEVVRKVEIVDNTNYHYSDTQNSYSVDFKIQYESKHRLFKITPYNLKFSTEKPKIKKTTVGVCYFAGNSGGLQIQYDLLSFLSVGGIMGWGHGEPLVGVGIGYRF